MAKEEKITDTTWTVRNILAIKTYIIEKMKEQFESYEENGKIYFNISDTAVMSISALKDNIEDHLVMVYTDPDDDDDGDRFFASDFSTPYDMFQAMLEEVKNNI